MINAPFLYPNVPQALDPLSAGTVYTTCVVCCPCSTGESVTSVYTPHPIWTNERGKDVVLLDAVALGGPNGLNS